VLTSRALGRALLARQLLLERRSMPVEAALEHLVGLQAQAPLAPYVGLWSRLAGFDATELADAVVDRRAVRASLMRSTIHLVTADDALRLRPFVQPVLERVFMGSSFARDLAGLELTEVLAAGRSLLAAEPQTRAALGLILAARFPGFPPDALVYANTFIVPLVHVPPRGVWGASGPAAWTTIETWLGRPLDEPADAHAIALRYLAAFGPATAADMRAWSGVARMQPVLDTLRPQLATFRDAAGRELFDLPDAPRPDPGVPAPARFLPEYDNVLIGHADRSRIIPAGRRIPLPPGNGASRGTFLLDGMFAGTWRITRDGATARLTIDPFEAVTVADERDLEAEGVALLAFAAAGYEPEIVVQTPGPLASP